MERREQQYWVSPQEIHNSEDYDAWYADIGSWQELDHEGRAKIDHCVDGNNKDRHEWNLSHYTGWYNNDYYHNGVKQT
jgi:hypothetical protein